MAYNPPTYGESGEVYTDNVRNSLEHVRTAAEAAQAAADGNNASVAAASQTADQALEVAEAAKAFVEAPTDSRVATLVQDSTSSTGAALNAALVGKQKTIEGGAFPAPLRAPTLVIDEEYPQYGSDYRLLWRDGDTLYAYWSDTNYGSALSKSTDGGATWTRQAWLSFTASPHMFLRLTDGTLLAGTGDPATGISFHRSTDDGATWTQVHDLRVEEQFLGPTSWTQDQTTGYVYFGVYYTADSGGTTSYTDLRVYRSTDNGATWSVFHTWPSAFTTDPDRVRHVHAVQWDPVSQRTYFMTGDGQDAAGIYRVTADGAGVEPVILNRQMPGVVSGARAIGIFPFDNYIGWGTDALDGWIRRMPRSDIGAANPVVEDIYRMNGVGFLVTQVADDDSRWMVSASNWNGLDSSVHLYTVEDEGATVYEVGAFAQDSGASFQVRIDPVGQPHMHGDTFYLNSFNDARPWAIKGRIALGTAGHRRPKKAVALPRTPILPADPDPGEANMPLWLANQEFTMPNKAFRGFGFIATKTETITQIEFSNIAAMAGATMSQIGVYRIAANGTLLLEAQSSTAAGRFTTANTRSTIALSASWTKQAGRWYCIGLIVDATTPPSFVGWSAPGLAPGGNRVLPRFCIGVANEGAQTGIPANGTAFTEALGGPCLLAR